MVMFVGFMMGCSTLKGGPVPREPHLEAQHLMEAGELYRAKRIAKALIEKDPVDLRAQQLMAEIISREVSRQKHLLEAKSIEEYAPHEKSEEVKTWLERSRALLSYEQYGEALDAAEKVFLYEPLNLDASRLIDEIHEQAYRQGKKNGLMRDQIVDEEIRERVRRYQAMAERGLEKGMTGSAQFAVEKMLLLEPDNPAAQQLRQRLRTEGKPQST
ncbi:MAG: hypothetical protein L0Y74_08060 [candidate division Zixibacteria bacterium]|nr:hypothetical protein [candidate division Zixibacteria bacterium]